MKQKSKISEELPNFHFPLFLDYREINDYDLKQKLPLELFLKHEGYELTIEKEKYILSISNYSERPRDSLKLETSTWRGISFNAIHFYGNLKLPSINFKEERTGDICGGYGIPETLSEIKLHRPLTREELLDKKRWKGYKVGEMFKGFKTIENIVERAKFITRKYFPDFKLIVPKIS